MSEGRSRREGQRGGGWGRGGEGGGGATGAATADGANAVELDLGAVEESEEEWEDEEGVEDGDGDDWQMVRRLLHAGDEDARAERLMCAVAASNVLRNLSFFNPYAQLLAADAACLEVVVDVVGDAQEGE